MKLILHTARIIRRSSVRGGKLGLAAPLAVRAAGLGLALALATWPAMIRGAEPTATEPVLATLALGDGERVPSWVIEPARCRAVKVEGHACLEFEPDSDPYRLVEWRLQLPRMNAETAPTVVVELEYVDQGAGLMDVAWRPGDGPAQDALHASRRASYTRLNTGQVRRAWFEFRFSAAATRAPGPAALSLTGVQHLTRVRLLSSRSEEAWRALQDAVPRNVKPMVTLERPIQLVTTAGVDVTGGMAALTDSVAAMNELAPLARVLGFTSIESYVTWKRIEPVREGEFDFSFYDGIVAKLAQYQLKWFPLLIVGSGYSLPDWFLASPENVGFVCLEHGLTNAIQSIWSPTHRRHVTRFLEAFGRHYEPMGVLEGVRLGPSGNYGESQYPASGNWGPRNALMHIHIGWWAGDSCGQADFRRWTRAKYPSIEALNKAWETRLGGFDDVRPALPATMLGWRHRLDFTAWYTDSMSDWCSWWAREARRAMPRTPMFQSAGGWGFRETGTDYSAQTKTMAGLDGGVRLTNETDSYEQNFFVTRLAATAARLYHAALGYEPASSHTARGVVGRIYNTAATEGDHLFTYHGNLFAHPLSIAKWLKYLPLLDARQDSIIDVAVYYPETENQLSDAAFRYLHAWGFYPFAREVRRVVDVDYLDERLIRAGFLDRYKVLVFAWGNRLEADVQATIDQWVRAGGTIIYPSYPRQPQETIEGDTSVFLKWSRGDTGRGAFRRFPGDMEPPSGYGEFVRSMLGNVPTLHRWTRQALSVAHDDRVFLTVQADGHLLALNYRDQPARVTLRDCFDEVIEPYGIARLPADPPGRRAD